MVRVKAQFWVYTITILGIINLLTGCTNIQDLQKQIHSTAAAGHYFPQKAKDLNALLKKAFQAAPSPKLDGNPIGLMVPHGAMKYTGVITAMAMRTLTRTDVDTIYILGTSHFANVRGAITWQGQAWRTPLGLYAIDQQAVRELLRDCPYIHLWPSAWKQEYSVDVPIPFLQTVAPKAKMVPLIFGTTNWEETWAIARAIAANAKGKKALVLISVDLAHYPSAEDSMVIDRQVLSTIQRFDPYALEKLDARLLAKDIPNLICTVCGLAALKTGMVATNLMGANKIQKIQYANTAMIAGKKTKVVGYGSLAFVNDPQQSPVTLVEKHPSQESVRWHEADIQELLDIARAAIVEGIATGKQLRPTTANPRLLEKHAVFIELTNRDGDVRGSMGVMEPRLPLYQSVAQMAVAAAFKDPRYDHIKASELPDLNIELSLISPLKPISDVGEIKLGQEGVLIRRGRREGFYFPQVPIQKKWSKEELLTNLCLQKARLPEKAWQEKGSQLYVFTVRSFKQPAPGRNP